MASKRFKGQSQYSKVKSRSHHDVTHPLTNVPTNYQPSMPLQITGYITDKILKVKVTTARSNQGHIMLHTSTPNQSSYQVITSYTLQMPRCSLDKILKFRVTTARSRVKSRSHDNVAHLHPQPMSLPSIKKSF